ncbi:MAG: DUF1853 family protein [Gammaproteobacteria bacterium]|nr:DUF1853 family protein [Gammaproteobacteria bacterium]
MASPCLLAAAPDVVSNDACQIIYRDNHDWLLALDKRPDLLLATLEKNNARPLGYYFEELVAFWLQQRIAGNYFESHVRVFEQKRALGEFDFLFTTGNNDTLVHWETAVKYYLYFKTEHEKICGYGPNPDDRLDIKLNRIFNHQLKLGSFPQALKLLEQIGFKSVKAQAFFKCYLFYPVNSQWWKPPKLPDYLAPDHMKGWWTRINRLELPKTASGQRWIMLLRLEWLAPKVINRPDDSRLLEQSQLCELLAQHFARSRQPLLIAQMARDDTRGWQEVSRGFVVGEHWPDESAEATRG